VASPAGYRVKLSVQRLPGVDTGPLPLGSFLRVALGGQLLGAVLDDDPDSRVPGMD